MPRLILSPVGTSVLTNNLEPGFRKELNKYSNKQEGQIPKAVLLKLQSSKAILQQKLNKNTISSLREMSAEFNGIMGIYQDNWNNGKKDIHYLLATDTYQGKVAAELLQGFLAQKTQTAEVITPKNLNTESKENFKSGIRDLLKWCEAVLPGYKESGYEIIFNLTGGFKSLQGYLNTIGMFYANAISYIFEGENELITIPKLPVKIETEEFERNADIYLQLAHTQIGIERKRIKQIPEIFIEEYDENRFILSDWGELSWNKVKQEILSNALIALPYISYSPSFIREFANTQRSKDKVQLQETIGKISCLLQENGGDISYLKGGRAGGLLYDNYSGKNNHLGHFRIGRSLRVSCEYKNQVLELRHYGAHDYVNNNP